ncbi:hypothetical protein BDZ91DRAFT_719165 [Kalaharituber pfeilii]|nr:hypothetical protein BDZ91DRAFT_719165 [Kalaharituber pfeilii]
MAKNKSKKSQSEEKRQRKQDRALAAAKLSSNPFADTTPATEESVQSLVATASELLRNDCSPTAALSAITRALNLEPTSLAAIELAGEINVELGDVDAARKYFEKAIELDSEGAHEDAGGSGPEKFLWLAQLCENGGMEAVSWYERGVKVLNSWIMECQSNQKGPEILEERGLKGKLCSALCGMAEIYMTDLCMEPDAEQRCEKYVTEALLAVPDSAEALQTLASVRISQTRFDDAKAALDRSVSLWKDLEPDSPNIPPYASRMAATRLLMETEMYDTAMEILEGLQMEDDQVVDLWYLGGWCLYLQGEKLREAEVAGKGKEKKTDEEREDWKSLWQASRGWLNNCAQLYQALDWDDERLKEHTKEILDTINNALGDEMDDDEEEAGEDDEWEDATDDEDEVMEDS